MSALPAPAAKRLVKPSWKDARLLIGILLVLLAVVLGALAFSAADNRVGVWAAKTTMTPGERIEQEDLVRVEVQLGDGAAEYVGSSERMPNGAVVDRTVRPGEIIPRSAVVDPTDRRVRPVPVHVDPIYLSNLTKGSRVGVYAMTGPGRSGTQSEEAAPPEYELILDEATVRALPSSSGGVIGSSSSAAATIVVPEEEVGRILTLDKKDTPIKLVAVVGSPERVD